MPFSLPRRTFLVLLATISLLVALTIAPIANLPARAQFVVDDRVVSDPTISLDDPEFDQINFRIASQDKQGRLWVANVDPVTGDFIPSSGKGTLVDTGLASIDLTKNGPEWAYGKDGSQILYTKLINNKGRTALGRARWTGSEWEAGFLEGGEDRIGSIGSLDPDDDTPRVKYSLRFSSGPRLGSMWREIDNPTTEGRIPDPTAKYGRWVEGERSLILTINVNGLQQVAKYDVDTDSLTQLTFDAGNKARPFMWKAPELNNQLVFLSMIDSTSVGVYRKIGENWTKINTLKPPSNRPYVESPEPFVYNGKSYISLLSTNTNDAGYAYGDVWIAPADPSGAFYRKVSDDQKRRRSDPEPFIANTGPFIYYTEVIDGVFITHRCATGLGSS